MLSLTFSISPKLQENLEHSAELNKQILLKPINPIKKNHLLWQNSLTKIYSSLTLSRHQTTLKAITNSVLKPVSDPTSKLSKNTKKALDIMFLTWANNPEDLTLKDIKNLYQQLTFDLPQQAKLRNKSIYLSDISPNLKSPTHPDHIPTLIKSLIAEINHTTQFPAITAALATIQTIRVAPFQHHNHLLAHCINNLVLAKHNLASEGLINLESIFVQNKETYTTLIEQSINTQTDLNKWLDFYIECLIKAQESTLNQIEIFSQKDNSILSKSGLINKRQQAIISLITDPNSRITNKDVVKNFRVSPITAARDLAKLRSLGMLYQIGSGRSTTYSKTPETNVEFED